jgi:hypothetical protein
MSFLSKELGGMVCAFCYVLNDVTLPEMGDDEEAMPQRHSMSSRTVV